MFACPGRSVLPGYYWVPADGISAAAYKRDFGTLRWPIQAKTTTVIGMRKRAAQCPLLAQSGHELVRCICLLVPQSGHLLASTSDLPVCYVDPARCLVLSLRGRQ